MEGDFLYGADRECRIGGWRTMTTIAYHRVRFSYDPGRAIVWRVLCDYLQPFVASDEGLIELGAGYGSFHGSFARERNGA